MAYRKPLRLHRAPRRAPHVTVLALVIAGAASWSARSAPARVTFEGFGANRIFGNEIVGDGLEVGTSDGFDFTSSGDHFHFGNGLVSVPSNGTSILLEDRNYLITMTKVGGGLFNLLSADLGEDNGINLSATSIVVTGFFGAGGSITATFTLDGNGSSFQNVAFAGFTNLNRVTFDGIGNPNTSELANVFTLDNINVPEPVTATLLPAGLLALRGLRRPKKRSDEA
jgi:hypothetical protein